jgi:hypothetical protein
MVDNTTALCSTCGAEAANGRAKLVHTGEIPAGTEPHDVLGLVSIHEWQAAQGVRTTLHVLASELLFHHVSIHPMSDCAFATRLAEALRSK